MDTAETLALLLWWRFPRLEIDEIEIELVRGWQWPYKCVPSACTHVAKYNELHNHELQ